jgi:hypothetical protein
MYYLKYINVSYSTKFEENEMSNNFLVIICEKS